MTTLTNDQITAGAAVLDFDLDELQALCDAVKRPWYGTLQIADGVTDDDAAKFIEAFSPDTVSDLIAAARCAPSPQVADIAELSKAEIDAIVYQCRQQGNDTTYDIVNAAIAASRRATCLVPMRDDTFTVIPPNMREYPMSVREADMENDLFRVAFDDACKEDKPENAEQELFAWDFFRYGWEAAVRLLNDDAERAAAQPAEGAGQAGQVAKDLLPPMGIRNDRDMLNYLMVAFDNEIGTCERCGHSEPTKNMDSASFLRQYLAAVPTERAAAPADIATTYKAQRDNLLAFIQNAPVSSGVCCCGDSMEKHYSPDHSAVDMWDHSVRCYAEEFAKFDTTHQPSAQKGGA